MPVTFFTSKELIGVLAVGQHVDDTVAPLARRNANPHSRRIAFVVDRSKLNPKISELAIAVGLRCPQAKLFRLIVANP